MRPRPRVHTSEMDGIFRAIRAEEELPVGFDPAVVEAARTVTPVLDHLDLTHVPFVSIDPPGSMDLDQAMAFESLTGGAIRVLYAIADVGAFVVPGDLLDGAARERGTTVYCPDRRVPLHPVSLSEGSASLLPDQDRPAVVFEVDVDGAGEVLRSHVRRAMIRSRRRFDYATLQSRFDAGTPPEPVALLEPFGRTRIERGIERGAVTLRLPDQEARQHQGRWQLHHERELAVERWNAEVSLLAGMVAASMMLEAGVGILRTLPAPTVEAVARLRAAIRALGIDWSRDDTVSAILAGLDPSRSHELAAFEAASRLLQGSGYRTFRDGPPTTDVAHAGVAAHYAHVTAPLRRLVDRFGLAACLAIAGDAAVPDWVLEALDELPATMATTAGRASRVENRCLDSVEAAVMGDRVGETFEAVVLGPNRGGVEVWIDEPPILTRVDGLRAKPGSVVQVRVTGTDLLAGQVDLERAA